MTKKRTDYEKNKSYILHVQGFPEPVVGKITDIKEAGEEVLLVIDKTDGTTVNVFAKSITGYSVSEIAA